MSYFRKPARRRSLPNLSEAQETALLNKVNAATAAAARGGMCEDSTKGKLAWRRAYLMEKTGVSSLTKIPRVGPVFGEVMKAFELVARDGFRWVHHVDSGNAEKAVPQYKLGEFMREHQIEERTVRGIAARALGFCELPHLHELDGEQTETVLGVLRGQYGTEEKRAKRANRANREAVPF